MDTAVVANLLRRGHSARIRFDGLLEFSFHGPHLLRAAFNLCRISGGSRFFAEGRSTSLATGPVFLQGHPSRSPPLAVPTIPHSAGLQHDEDALAATALVVLIVGTHPSLAPYQVRHFVQENYGVASCEFTLHHYWPEDYLIIFRNLADLQCVLDAPPLPRADMVLRFCRWNRLSMAEGESMRYRVLVKIRGIPAHAWSTTTAQIVLADAYATPELTPTTAAWADLRRFQVVVWCSDPDLIPNEAVIRIPECVDSLGDNVLFLRPQQIIHHDLPLLRYKIEIEILEIQDSNDSCSSDDSGTLPDHALTDSDDEDDYPRIHQNSRSHPLLRRTVFRTPGFGDGPGNSVDGGGPSSWASVDCTSLGGRSLPLCTLALACRWGNYLCTPSLYGLALVRRRDTAYPPLGGLPKVSWWCQAVVHHVMMWPSMLMLDALLWSMFRLLIP
ncbi:hypothetical protein C2845_PM02G17040 [Panicum miliaceum]|uniref:DUF4283 domain-containing protein n=1 Tax=Panicum miliaceum TaxID=4540 RepID=A0A3L6SFP2_PANMI|nr:hypothetical protein C2845_PM02G17040 [Panicum miliaceum]